MYRLRQVTGPFNAGFVNVDDFGVLDLLPDLFVFAATGARSVLYRVPHGESRELQLGELIELVGDFQEVRR